MKVVCFHLWVETVIWSFKRKADFVSIDVDSINWRYGSDTLFQNNGLTALQELFPVDESLRLNFLLIPVVVAHSWLKNKNVNIVKYRGSLQVPLMIKLNFITTTLFEAWV